jgi:hypothetical protein
MMGFFKILVLAIDIITISDVLSKYRDWGTRLVLIVMVLAVPLIGAGIYWVVFRPKD